MKDQVNIMRILFALVLLYTLGCAAPEIVSVTDEGTGRGKISPAAAFRLASPHLDAVFKLRCRRHLDKRWCDKPPRDTLLIEGEYYHVTRESYPYKTLNAYLKPAVRVHRNTGKIELPNFADN
jgi:hypothetical protein